VGEDKLIHKGDDTKELDGLDDWSHDGRYLAFASLSRGGPERSVEPGRDLWALTLSGERKVIPVAETRFDESFARISPDSRWIAYVSQESGRSEVYVQSFPDPRLRQQISSPGGRNSAALSAPRWGRDSKEVFYIAQGAGNSDSLISVSIKPSASSVGASAPVTLFKTAGIDIRPSVFAGVAPDGRFLFAIPPDQGQQTPTQTLPITVVLNWAAGIKK
jgi:Tol biopolymer transport system component